MPRIMNTQHHNNVRRNIIFGERRCDVPPSSTASQRAPSSSTSSWYGTEDMDTVSCSPSSRYYMTAIREANNNEEISSLASTSYISSSSTSSNTMSYSLSSTCPKSACRDLCSLGDMEQGQDQPEEVIVEGFQQARDDYEHEDDWGHFVDVQQADDEVCRASKILSHHRSPHEELGMLRY